MRKAAPKSPLAIKFPSAGGVISMVMNTRKKPSINTAMPPNIPRNEPIMDVGRISEEDCAYAGAMKTNEKSSTMNNRYPMTMSRMAGNK
jgi:hypothetical protein